MAVLEEIFAERKYQVEAGGRRSDLEDQCDGGELARAAAVYALGSTMTADELEANSRFIDEIWPSKLGSIQFQDRRKDLIYSAALIVAEIERLDRIEANMSPPGPASLPAASALTLTVSQTDALTKLALANDWVLLHQVGVREATMLSLATLGLVEGRHISGWTRWRITEAKPT